jgi:hypothetical protein
MLIYILLIKNSLAQRDTISSSYWDSVTVSNPNKQLIDSIVYSEDWVIYRHYDTITKRFYHDSTVNYLLKQTIHYYRAEGQVKEYHCPHDTNVCYSYTCQEMDTIDIFHICTFTNNDTNKYSDTFLLYYPDLGAANYYDFCLTLEALEEAPFFRDTSSKIRISTITGFETGHWYLKTYTMTDLYEDTSLLTIKSGLFLFMSVFEPKRSKIKNYTYTETKIKISNKNANKFLKQVQFIENPRSTEILDAIIIEYLIGKKYHVQVFSSDLTYYKDYLPIYKKKLKMLKKVLIFLNNLSK